MVGIMLILIETMEIILTLETLDQLIILVTLKMPKNLN